VDNPICHSQPHTNVWSKSSPALSATDALRYIYLDQKTKRYDVYGRQVNGSRSSGAYSSIAIGRPWPGGALIAATTRGTHQSAARRWIPAIGSYRHQRLPYDVVMGLSLAVLLAVGPRLGRTSTFWGLACFAGREFPASALRAAFV
jgi:hypothetical protein